MPSTDLVEQDTTSPEDHVYVHPGWQDNPKVAAALNYADWPNNPNGLCDALHALHGLLEALERPEGIEALSKMEAQAAGLSPGQIMDLAVEAARAENDPECHDDGDGEHGLRSRIARRHFRTLHLAGLDADRMAALSGIAHDTIEKFINRQGAYAGDQRPRRVLRLHNDGKTPGEICRATGLADSAVRSILVNDFGLEPHRYQAPALTKEQQARAADLVEEGGLTQTEIAERIGCTVSQVRHAWRRRQKGTI